MKRLFLVGIAILMLGSLASGQSGAKIDFWYPFGGDSEVFYLKMFDRFNKLFPNYKVDATYVEGGGLETGKLLAAIASGDVPDVVESTNYALAYGLISQGALEPLDAHLAKIGVNPDKDIVPGFRKMLSSGGRMYLLPEVGQVVLTYYNKAMLQKAGLSTTNLPTTFEELDAYAKALTEVDAKGEIKRMGM
ncbi:MAG: extracellular solute-binding protein, partial [Armatimonadetes bacterium]|nr:extracellular solute-binding protein [Armatimonadota bacterium]